MPAKILIIEDNPDLSKMIDLYLKKSNYASKICASGGHAINIYEEFGPDLILLDLMLPEINGLEILAEIRLHSTIPIIIISAKESERDRITGLKLGADDYVTKPFSLKELIARVDAHLRRQNYQITPMVSYNDISINLLAQKVTKGGRLVNLTTKEFAVLQFFVEHPAQVLSKEQIYNQVWSYDQFGDLNTVTIHIQKIREKMPNTHGITTVRGSGYRFDGELHEKKS
ncbi:response regulator transcription factor [Xylocopilactobacillus apicola]|uniref:DNA-binding response regulator n=1 Tax=Xylocopilactobacillus apicola TaxID=2932184 RepID=A0AAU9DX67_9LACO|nr:response regulator transcription factor [Xylocopilactobacillus apicola]BDR58698.1 DNA-binding response regulator [Xylocopilactobacillus apicola]